MSATAQTGTTTGPANSIDKALVRLYNFDFDSAERILAGHIAGQPQDPLGHAFRAAVVLFGELDRLKILEAEFFADDKRLIEKQKLKPDPKLRATFFETIAAAEQSARARLARTPGDVNAVYAQCVARGLVSDYVSLIEKKHLGSLKDARQSHNYALELLRLDPSFHDAYLTTGLSEYLLGSIPFFVRWFVKFDQTQGSKAQAVQNLELVAAKGRYMGPFARILLSIIHLREKRPQQSHQILAGLARDFPENPLIRRELTKLTEKLQSAAGTGTGRL